MNFSGNPSLGDREIDLSKLDMKLMRVLTTASSRADFNNASFPVLISTHVPVSPGAFLGADDKPIAGVIVQGSGATSLARATVTVESLQPLSRDPNVKYIHNATPLRVV